MNIISTVALVSAGLFLPDPPAPPGGFPVVATVDQVVTWSDGYVTLMDLYEPGVPSPATGWPAVLVFHGSGGTRQLPDVVSAARYLAAAGYVTYAFDGRGAGNWTIRNPGWTTPRSQERDLADSAAAHGVAQSILPGKIDPSRIALTGFSGGGKKSFAGAAWSGQMLPVAGAVTHYPVVSAIAPEIAPLASREVAAPGGTLASDHKIKGLPATDPMILALLAGNYASYTNLAGSLFDDNVLVKLQTTTVPMLMMVAAQDNKIINNPSIDAFTSMTPPAPRRMIISTGGHSTVKNTHERALQQELRRRWFDRFLKSAPNGADAGPFVELAVQPPTNAAHANPATIWEHRNETEWPPARTSSRLYLRDVGTLTAAAPAGPAAGLTLAHRVAPGFDVAAYVAVGGGLAASSVLAQIPKVKTAFLSAPLTEPTEIIGRGQVTLVVDDTTGFFQLNALLQHVAPNGDVTWITDGAAGARPGVPGTHTVTIDLSDVAHVVPAGHRLRLTVMNVADHNPPAGRRIRMVPYFTDTDSTILVEAGAESFVDLPLGPYRTNISPRLEVASGAAGIQYQADLRGGPSRAGLPYALFMSGSGEAPGLALPGPLHLPLNVDLWTSLGVQLQNTVVFPAMVGLLDPNGRAIPGMVVPAGPVATALIGQEFTFAAVVLAPPAIDSISGPVTLVIDP